MAQLLLTGDGAFVCHHRCYRSRSKTAQKHKSDSILLTPYGCAAKALQHQYTQKTKVNLGNTSSKHLHCKCAAIVAAWTKQNGVQ